LIYSPLSAYFDDVIPQQPALNNDGKQRQPALGDLSSPIQLMTHEERKSLCTPFDEFGGSSFVSLFFLLK
jgi:hypothetical protein